MQAEEEQAIKLRLLAGLPIDITDAGLLRAPTLRRISEIGEAHYNRLVSALLFDASQLENRETDDKHSFELLFAYCYYNDPFRLHVLEAVELFFQRRASLAVEGKRMQIVLGDQVSTDVAPVAGRIDASNFERLQDVVKLVNHMKLPSGPEFAPANPRAKAMIERIVKARRNKPAGKMTVNLHSIVSGMAWRSPALSIASIFDLTVYQLYDGFFRLETIDQYHFTLTGVYTGAMDGTQINFASLHWTSIHQNN